MKEVTAKETISPFIIAGKKYPLIAQNGDNFIVICEKGFELGFKKGRFNGNNKTEIEFQTENPIFGKRAAIRRHPKEKIHMKQSRKLKIKHDLAFAYSDSNFRGLNPDE